MKNQSYKLHAITEIKDGKVSGPMSPMLVAEQMVTHGLAPAFQGLFRVHTDDHAIHQKWEGIGYTGYDTLILACESSKGERLLAMFVDEGVGARPLALYYNSDPIDQIEISPLYEEADYKKKLNQSTLQKIFKEASVMEIPGLNVEQAQS